MTMKESKERILPKFARSELTLGKLLGQGGFSWVYEVSRIQVDEVYNLSDSLTRIREEVANDAMMQHNGHPRYAVKMLRDDLQEEDHSKGAIDLGVEARLLKRLSHPNIIKMIAMANSDPLESRFFIILEILQETLDDKLTYWRREITKTMSLWCGPFGYCCANKPVLHRLWIERITVATGIASALKYLHNQDMIYRDLKPENIGFDESGQVKLFDFGLAKKLYDQDKVENGLYRLTGNTGSLRYMAPEVALNGFYNLKCDSFSFAIVFWQICALQTPFAGYNIQDHADLVVGKGYRPKIERSWPFAWSQLMRTCWSTTINERLNFDEIFDDLNSELQDLNSRVNRHVHVEIKAKKKVKDVEETNLDVDTRKAFSDNEINFSTGEDGYNSEIV